MAVHPGRWRARIDGDFVVFIIGMRINKPWAVRRWLPVAMAMPAMVREATTPEIGLMYTRWCPNMTLIQYWRSFAQLEAYARDPHAKHLPAWQRYNRTLRGNDAVGVWHETYRVSAGDYEAIFVDMPRQGLALAGEHEAVGSTTTAAQRIGVRDTDAAPVQP